MTKKPIKNNNRQGCLISKPGMNYLGTPPSKPRELPDVSKCCRIVIDDSIADAELLAVVSALIATIQSGQVKLNNLTMPRNLKQKLIFSLDLWFPQAMIDRGIQDLLSRLLTCKFTINDGTEKQVEYTQHINKEQVYALAKPSARSFAQSAGILIGAEAPSIFDLKKYTEGYIEKQYSNLITVLKAYEGCYAYSVIEEFAVAHNFAVELIYDKYLEETKTWTYKDIIEQVINSELVVGPPSFYTYAAACLDIPVIEIFETQEQLKLLSKWSSFRYAAVMKDESEFLTISRLEKAWSHWHGVDVNHQNPQMLMSADG